MNERPTPRRPATAQHRFLRWADHPELAEKLDATVKSFAQRGPRFACRHVLQNGGPSPFLCAQHPRVGLLCEPCARVHLTRHDGKEEHCCDRCRETPDTIGGVIMELRAVGLRVRTPKGPRARLSGSILVIGTGLCASCAPAPSLAAS